MNAATFDDAINRLHKVYVECGGTKFQQQEELDLKNSLYGFDALKVLIVKKLAKTRETIARRDELLKKKVGGASRTAKLSNEIRQMIRFIQKDRDRLAAILEKNKKPKGLFKKVAPDPKMILQQTEDLHLIDKHIEEVEALDKRRFKAAPSRKKEEKSEETQKFLSANLAFEENLPDDARYSNLPEIDISRSLAKVQENKKLIDAGLDQFSKKLENLKEIAQDTSAELDEHIKLVDRIDHKVDTENENLANLTKNVDKTIEEVNKSTRLACVCILFTVFAIILGVLLLYLSSWF